MWKVIVVPVFLLCHLVEVIKVKCSRNVGYQCVQQSSASAGSLSVLVLLKHPNLFLQEHSGKL